MLDVALQLRCAHGSNVLHRDIKTNNIVISDVRYQSRSAHLIDFGLSCKLTKDDPFTCGRVTGAAIGSFVSMSPENFQSASMIRMVPFTDSSFASDVFAFGATFYTVLTNKWLYGTPTRWHYADILLALKDVQVSDWCEPRKSHQDINAQDLALLDGLHSIINRMIAINPLERPSMVTIVMFLQKML